MFASHDPCVVNNSKIKEPKSDKQITYHYQPYIKLQEMFHVYLKKFENDVTHLFLVIIGND